MVRNEKGMSRAGELLAGLEQARDRLQEEARERKEAAREVARLAKEKLLADRKKLARGLKRFDEKVTGPVAERLDLAGLAADLHRFLDHFEELTRRELGLGLKEACERAGLELLVVSREEPVEIRIPPLAVLLDFAKGRAELHFARQKLDQCPLVVEKIMAAREKALEKLERSFDPERFFDRCHRAYRRHLALTGGREGDRVELNDFLPELAFLQQPARFRQDPSKANYRQYGKAEFAYDVLRLRRAGMLRREGRRINFGVATGTTATKKKRVLYLEDETGVGEYKLTIFFTATGS